jgi:hypothetical protein
MFLRGECRDPPLSPTSAPGNYRSVFVETIQSQRKRESRPEWEKVVTEADAV